MFLYDIHRILDGLGELPFLIVRNYLEFIVNHHRQFYSVEAVKIQLLK